MSRTYEIVCHECRVRLWFGQGWPGRNRMYRNDKFLDLLEAFLFDHQYHRIEAGDDEYLDLGDDYTPLHDE